MVALNRSAQVHPKLRISLACLLVKASFMKTGLEALPGFLLEAAVRSTPQDGRS